MSTKALRDLVALAEAASSHAHKSLTAAARAELASIERAAKAYEEAERDGHSPDALEEAHRLMLSIAKDAP